MEFSTSDNTIIISLGNSKCKRFVVNNDSQSLFAPQMTEFDVVFQIHPNEKYYMFEDKTQCPFEDTTVRNFVKELKNGRHSNILLNFENYEFTAKEILCSFIKNLILHYSDDKVIRDYIFVVDRDEIIPIIQECSAYNHIHPKFIRASNAVPYSALEKFIDVNDYPFYGIFFDFGKTAFQGYVAKYTQEGFSLEKELYDESISGDRFTTILLDFILQLYRKSPDLDPENEAQRVLEKTSSKIEYANYFKAAEKVKTSLSPKLDSLFESNTISASPLQFSTSDFMKTENWSEFANDITKIVKEFIKDYKEKNIKCFEFLGMTSASSLLIETVFKEISDDFGHPQTSYFNLSGPELVGANIIVQNKDTKYIFEPEMPKPVGFTKSFEEFMKLDDELEESKILSNDILDYQRVTKFNMKLKNYLTEKISKFDDESIDELEEDLNKFSNQSIKELYEKMTKHYGDQVNELFIRNLSEFSVDFDGEQINFKKFNEKLNDNKTNNPTINESIKDFIEACFAGFKFSGSIFGNKFILKWCSLFNILYRNYINHQNFLESSNNGEIPQLSYLDLIEE